MNRINAIDIVLLFVLSVAILGGSILDVYLGASFGWASNTEGLIGQVIESDTTPKMFDKFNIVSGYYLNNRNEYVPCYLGFPVGSSILSRIKYNYGDYQYVLPVEWNSNGFVNSSNYTIVFNREVNSSDNLNYQIFTDNFYFDNDTYLDIVHGVSFETDVLENILYDLDGFTESTSGYAVNREIGRQINLFNNHPKAFIVECVSFGVLATFAPFILRVLFKRYGF